MNYDEEELGEEKGFGTNPDGEDEEMMEPLEETDFGLDEEDPDRDR